MAIVKFNGKQVNGVARVKVTDKHNDRNIGIIQCMCFTGEFINIEFNKCEYIRVECKSDLQTLSMSNVATVIGNVSYAKVSNCLFVEGYINNYKTPSGKYTIDKTTRVCYGKEKQIRNGVTLKNKAKICHIDGKLLGLSVNISNQSIETVVFGNVEQADIGNCLSVRGTVKDCVVGNNINCALGKAEVPSLETVVKQRKNREDELNKFIGDFKGLFK